LVTLGDATLSRNQRLVPEDAEKAKSSDDPQEKSRNGQYATVIKIAKVAVQRRRGALEKCARIFA
jgi:hypothetical protein